MKTYKNLVLAFLNSFNDWFDVLFETHARNIKMSHKLGVIDNEANALNDDIDLLLVIPNTVVADIEICKLLRFSVGLELLTKCLQKGDESPWGNLYVAQIKSLHIWVVLELWCNILYDRIMIQIEWSQL